MPTTHQCRHVHHALFAAQETTVFAGLVVDFIIELHVGCMSAIHLLQKGALFPLT